MGIAITEEHRALAASVHGFAERNITARGMEHEPFRAALAAQGVLGLHLPEEYGGQGGGLPELAVALEALGEHCAPGSHLPSVLASAIIARSPDAGTARGEPRGRTPEGAGGAAVRALLPALADGTLTAAVVLPESSLAGLSAEGHPGSATALGSAEAGLFVLPLPDGRWAALDRADCVTAPLEGIDLTRPLAAVAARAVPDGRVLTGVTGELVSALAAVLLGAEACGAAAWAVTAAAGHARVREQFGRPIGQFQGVKHRCAAMLVALEQARAAVWDAARALDGEAADGRGTTGAQGTTGALSGETLLAVAAAGVLAADAAVRCTADAIQVLGGIGYTYEHDAHLYYRRALSLRALSGDPGGWAGRVAALAAAGTRRDLDPDLPEEAGALREEIGAAVASLAAEEPLTRLARFAAEGWLMPYLPEPWGRAASPLEQVVIHQEFQARGVKRPNLAIAAWAVPSIVRYGTREQQERFLPRTLTTEIMWCQLFSEPGAGSDLAALSTRAVRVEGGWSLNGQKIWTSLAQYAHWGICLARTDPDAPKHEGITYFLVDMKAPGVTVRPLKEINGDEVFNEVFLDDVFVPDENVVGEVNRGWRVARDTLSHERVALGDSWGPGSRHTDMAELVVRLGGPDALRPAALEQAGRLWAEGQAISALGLRVTLSQLSGGDPGTASSVRKLLGMRHSQAVSEFCWSIAPASPYWSRMVLTTRAFTIGGGTTEVQLNIIAERALGLPRDP
ncbi:acyl-CoA dehydrogenase [Planomonospora venezuelensis]|uniref:Alkylation response protein AidB-like acyl-CoA dehydrogenase n=1 Tax=Planomonospora venezuelensis TaxID=1999 RepID=A0A841D769_PLAVE|nr:acyl-CoA dehydrogenase [Planomonospora venezuelensis]MBB5964337.1 alkylation response protein AidB-like acyl-CoA dehydrogenase [Planomonospora venezuelensis]GIM98510.1 putative acyl-CoA dehydrogenase FadE [Planomonospora venezuelensis]